MTNKRIIITLYTICAMTNLFGQANYGDDVNAGKYVKSGDAEIYYEIYGKGEPLVLLHGALYGYIDEYTRHIPHLSKHFKVIAIATRGHGKSGFGSQPFSYDLLARDVKAVLDKEKFEYVNVFGFSTGAVIGHYFNAKYPNYVKKLVIMSGGSKIRPSASQELRNLNYANFAEDNNDFIVSRKSLMPEPERYPELIKNLKLLWFDKEYVKADASALIDNPVLIIAGDRDDYYSVEQFVGIYNTMSSASLSIVPDRNHVGLLFDQSVLLNTIIPFLLND